MSSFDLRIASGFQVATYPAGATFGPRASRDFEFVWMIEGDATYSAGETVAAPQGSILLCKPGVEDSFVWDTRRRTRHGWFHFRINGETPPEWGTPGTWATVRTPRDNTDLLTALFRALLASGANHAESALSATTRLLALSLFAAFVSGESQSGSGIETPQYPDAVTQAMAFIATRLEESPGDALPLCAIARAAFVSPEHLCRLFQTHTRHTPAETVRLMRLDRAATLLVRTNFSVGEIATMCGFASQFHFSRRFKDAFGQTPSDLRRAVAEGVGVVPTTRLLRIAGITAH